ncbi:MAG: hypothetical protein P1P65_00175 [Treponema sp.]
MKHTIGRIAGYTVLYLCVILGIFILQFTKGKTFSVTVGAVTVTGRQERTEAGEEIPLLPIHIVSNGLDLYISEQNPVYAIRTEDKNTVALAVRGYSIQESGFSIQCSEDVMLSFFSEDQGEFDTLRIEAALPEHITQVLLPWKITQNAAIERDGGKIFVRSGKKQYTLTGSFHFNAEIPGTPEQQEVPHLVLGKMQPVAYYKTYLPFQGLDITAIPAMAEASAETYSQMVERFTAAVINAGKQALSSKKINEKMIAAYMAEMGRQNMFSAALEAVPAKLLAKDMKTYLTNPFYNNLQQTHTGLVSADTKQRELYAGLLKAHDVQIFEHEGLIPFLIDRGSKNSIQDTLSLIETADPAGLTARQAAGVLSVWLDYSRLFPDKKGVSDDILAACEKKLEKALVLIDGGLYLSNDGAYIDTADSLMTAQILLRYGALRSAVWQAAARMMISSLLRYAGEFAVLPAGFTITGRDTAQVGLIADDSRMLDAGMLYPLVLPDNSWYPHAQSLAVQAEPGIWAWTCAQEIKVLENTAKTLTLRIRFPEGASHYLTLHGIRPFYRIELYGIPFRSDARFEMYNSSGYAYNANSKVLYLKMRHKSEYEIIKLSLGKPPQPKPVETAVPAAEPSPAPEASAVQTAPSLSGEEPAEKPDISSDESF